MRKLLVVIPHAGDADPIVNADPGARPSLLFTEAYPIGALCTGTASPPRKAA